MGVLIARLIAPLPSGGEDDFDLFGQTASARLKRGTARRGTPG